MNKAICTFRDNKKSMYKDFGDNFRKYAVPLYCQGQEATGDLVGSGTLIQLGSETFVMSCSHVLDDIKTPGDENRIYIPWDYKPDGEMRSYTGMRYDAKDKATSEPIDVIFLHLPNDHVRQLRLMGQKPIQIANQAAFDLPDKWQVAFCGFPATRNNIKSNYVQGIEFFSIFTRRHPQEAVVKAGLKKWEMPYVYSRKKCFSGGRKISGPIPNGMSGGPVFAYYDSEMDLLTPPRFFGIGVQWADTTKKTFYIASIRIDFVLAACLRMRTRATPQRISN